MALCGRVTLGQSSSDLGSPTTGLMYWNTTSNEVRFYGGTAWTTWPGVESSFPSGGAVQATGGDVVCCSGGGYVCHIFYNSGSLTLSAPLTSLDNIYFFMLSGGGGGGGNSGAGGGGGASLSMNQGPPCNWLGPFCFNKVPNMSPLPNIETLDVVVGGGGGGGNCGTGGDGGRSCARVFTKDGGPRAAATINPFFPNTFLTNCFDGPNVNQCTCAAAQAMSATYQDGSLVPGGKYAIMRTAWVGGGGVGSQGQGNFNGGSAGCAPCGGGNFLQPAYYPNGGRGNLCDNPGQFRVGGGGGNYGFDCVTSSPSTASVQGDPNNITNAGFCPGAPGTPWSTYQCHYGGAGSFGYNHPDFPFLTMGGGGAGGSHIGNVTDPATWNAIRTCGDGGCSGCAAYPSSASSQRIGGSAPSISSPYASGSVGGGGGAGSFNGFGGNGSSGIVIIKYCCL